VTDPPNDPQQPATDPQEKKIIIDEDWKSQVEAEKEAMKREQESAPSSQAEAAGQAAGPLPPPSLALLATSVATQAMVSLGLVPHPISGKTEVQLDQAKHSIDLLEVLQQKTEGNRTAEETAMLDHLLHELRMGYVAIREKGPTPEK